MNIITVGIDLAKNVFAVHSVNDSGKPELVNFNFILRDCANADSYVSWRGMLL